MYYLYQLVRHIGSLRMPMVGLVALVAIITSCQKEDVLPAPKNMEVQVVPFQDTLRGIITEHTLLVNNRTWYIDGLVYISNEATLTIEPGTTVKVITNSSKSGLSQVNGGLIVTRGSKLVARGTRVRPILFTVSDSAINCSKGWHGIIVLGRAPVNKPFALPGNIILPAGNGLAYGGDLPEDSSGILQYVQLDYIDGKSPLPAVMQSGLLVLGTGSRTVIKNVTVHLIGEKHRLKNSAQLP